MPTQTHYPLALPEGGVNSSQVQGKQGGGWVAFGPCEVESAPPPSTDQSRGSSMPGPWSQGAGPGDELWVSVIWMCPDPIVFFHGPKWTLPVPLITLGRAASFHRGSWTKEALLCPSPSGPKITEKVPGKKKKKKQLAHSFKWKERCLNRWDGWTDKQTYSKASYIYEEIGTQSTSANKAVYMGSDEEVCKSLMDLSKNAIQLCTKNCSTYISLSSQTISAPRQW